MNSLALHRVSPNDSEFAYCAKRAAFKEYVEKVDGWDDDEQRRLHEQRFRTQDFRVITLAGTDVGIMAVVAAPDCVKVNQLFLSPEHQGKNIGRRCMLLGFTRTGETDTHALMEWGS